MSKLKLKL